MCMYCVKVFVWIVATFLLGGKCMVYGNDNNDRDEAVEEEGQRGRER